jgi:hypothetical protein
MTQELVEITGIKLESDHTGGRLTVFLEIDGEWNAIIETRGPGGGIVSHIVEPNGIRLAAIERRPHLA